MLIILIVVIFSLKIFSQDNPIIIIGDSLKGMIINGESVREVSGNVILTQGNVKVTCDKAIQYIVKNDAELIGNVIVTQDTLTIKTQRGYYYGNLRKTSSIYGVELDDKKVILTAKEGEYFFDENKAVFKKNVKLYDTIYTLNSDKLIYFRDEDKAIATGSVKIFDQENTIFCDSLEHFRIKQISYAFNNVLIKNNSNNIIVLGQRLQDFRIDKYTLIDSLPLLIQVDTIKNINEENVEEITFDTLFITSKKMEIFRVNENKFIVTDSVKIIRGLFSSLNDLTIYLIDSSKIISYKISDDLKQPVIWYSNSQLSGDSITIYLEESKITRLDVDGNSFMLTQNEAYPMRFDQSSSKSSKIYFNENKVSKVEYYDKVYSIYFLYEDNLPNGLIKTTSNDAIIFFNNNEINDVQLIGNPGSEYYPENLVENNERNFLLPKFNFIETRPSKIIMYEKLGNYKWQIH
jgi:lipopolysaccharide export system protein LptA